MTNYAKLILGIFLVLGSLIRVGVVSQGFRLEGDGALRYDPIARNLIAGNGFSRALSPPFTPDSFDQPLYPLFLAGIYLLSGESTISVAIFQLIIEALTLLLLGKTSSLMGLRSSTGRRALGLALVSPFLLLFIPRILTEVLATFLVVLAIYLMLLAWKTGRLGWWALAGAGAGLGILTRPDLIVVLALAMLYFGFLEWRKQGGQAIIVIPVCAFCCLLVLVPWMVRNYRAFGELRPLGGVATQAQTDYADWLNTWLDDPKYLPAVWWNAMDRNTPIQFPEGLIPDHQEDAAINALKQAREQSGFEGGPGDAFARLTESAKEERPFYVRFMIPMRRVMKSWGRMPAYIENHYLKIVGYVFWVFLLGCSLVGAAVLLTTNREALGILCIWVLGRAVLPWISALAIEPRYQLEALPACFLLAAVGIGEVIAKVRKGWVAGLFGIGKEIT